MAESWKFWDINYASYGKVEDPRVTFWHILVLTICYLAKSWRKSKESGRVIRQKLVEFVALSSEKHGIENLKYLAFPFGQRPVTSCPHLSLPSLLIRYVGSPNFTTFATQLRWQLFVSRRWFHIDLIIYILPLKYVRGIYILTIIQGKKNYI